MSDEAVTVVMDDRARLVSAVLAAGEWPEREQAQLTHAVHPHAKQTRHFLAGFADHPAVTGANQALAAGVSLDDLFSAALRCTWPDFAPLEPLPAAVDDAWVRSLADFVQATAVVTLWAEHDTAWQEALADLRAIFADDRLAHFLERLTGRPFPHRLLLMPNLTYPALSPVLAETQTAWSLILPLLKAVGESPPWPYREDPATVLAQACRRLFSHALHNDLASLNEEQQALLQHAAITLFLEEALDEFEAQAYLVRSRKQHNLPRLPLVVEAMRGALVGSGRNWVELLREQ